MMILQNGLVIWVDEAVHGNALDAQKKKG